MGKQGCVSCVEYLVKELGFDANSRRLKDKCTPLHIAYYNLHGAQLEKMSSALVAMKADTQLKNKWGEMPELMPHESITASPTLVADFDVIATADIKELSLDEPACLDSDSATPGQAKTVALSANAREFSYPTHGSRGSATVKSKEPWVGAWQPHSIKASEVSSEGSPANHLFVAARQAALGKLASSRPVTVRLQAAPAPVSVPQVCGAPAGWTDKLGRSFHPSLLGGDCLC